MLAMLGKGRQKELKRLFDNDSRTLQVTLPDGEVCTVHVQAQYVHLRGVLDRDGTMAAKARRRLAMAISAFDRQRKLLLQNRYVTEHVRGAFFRSLVTATLNNLALCTKTHKSWPNLVGGYNKLMKRLLMGRANPENILRMSAAEVQWRVQQISWKFWLP